MKKSNRFAAVLSAVTLSVCMCVPFVGCDKRSEGSGEEDGRLPVDSVEEYYVTGIEIETDERFKTSYADGEPFDTTGMTVKATWNDGYVEENVSSSKYYVVPSIITDGVTSVTVHYGDASKLLEINPVKITGVAVLRPPAMSTYFVGETFRIDGLELGWTLDDGTTRSIPNFDVTDVVFDAEHVFASGDKSVSLEYAGYTFDISVSVRGRGVKMEVTDESEYVVMSRDDGKDPKCVMGTNATLKAMASNGDFMQNFAEGDIMTFTFDSDTAQVNLLFQGSSTYVTEYGKVTTWAPLVVEDMQVSRIFDLEVNGRSAPISNHAILPGARAADGKEDVKYLANWTEVDLGIVNVYTDKPNVVKLKFKDNGYRNQDGNTGMVGTMMPAPYIDYLMIGVVEDGDTVTGIEITTEPAKKEYVEGQSFDAAGMTVVATHKDGRKTELPRTAYNVTPNVMTELGENVLTISHAECTDSVTVNVIERIMTGIEITAEPTIKDYGIGQAFDPTGMIVSAEYNDGSTEPITDYTFSPDGVLTDSDTVITISAYGFTATVNVTVSNVEIVESYTVTGVPTDALSVGDPLPTIDASAITVTAHYYSGNTKTFSASEYELSVPTGNAELGSAVVITLKDESGTKIARCFNVSRKIEILPSDAGGIGENGGNATIETSTNPSGGKYVKNVNGQTLKIEFDAQETNTGRLVLRGSSTRVTADNFGEIGEMLAKKCMKLKVNGNEIVIADNIRFIGKSKEDCNGKGVVNLGNWCDLVFDGIPFVSGKNTVEFSFIKDAYPNNPSPYLDTLTVAVV